MHQGRIMRAGSATDVWRDPRSAFVASFIGHGTIIERDGKQFAVRADAVTIVALADADSADLLGRVTSCVFQGDRFAVEVAVDADAAVDVDATHMSGFVEEPLMPGDRVGVRIDESRLAPLDSSANYRIEPN
jgi:ABC-type Fe3+/spermidine/putrescine transport system ATPase subunit